jgi:NAD(P)-dependent dehydrogenase (short-subunit alcohol dehydrogenase family)
MARTFVVVGASTGLGRETARRLARDHRVIVAGRDVERTRAAVPGSAMALRVDLADLGDVARFTAELAAYGPFDGLVCNAGVQQTGEPGFTRDGFEETFGVNHLAHFAIAMQLAPWLAPGARVAWIGSGTMDPANRSARRFGFRGGLYTDARALVRGDGDATASAAQRARDRYATSKLCNLLTVAAIARRVPAARFAAFALDPGLMPGTGLARQYPPVMRVLWHTVMRAAGLVMPGASTAARSGAALAWLMTDPSLAGTTGRYFDFRRREIMGWFGADRADWADELYDASLALCGIAGDPLRAAA